MLPLEEKNYRRTQYARSRGRGGEELPPNGREEGCASGDSSRSDDGELTQGGVSSSEPMPALPRISFESLAKPSPAEDAHSGLCDLSAAGALLAMMGSA